MAAETKLWRQTRRHASDVRLVNRGLSGQPMAARAQFEGSLGGALQLDALKGRLADQGPMFVGPGRDE